MIFIISTSIFCFFLYYFTSQNRSKLNGVYNQRGRCFWLKKCLAYLILTYRKCSFFKKSKTQIGYGLCTTDYERMEMPQPLINEKSIDSIYINGMDDIGNFIIMRIGRRVKNQVEIWLTMDLINGGGRLQLPSHPYTNENTTNGSEFDACGLKFQCVDPMRKWKITFNGLMRKGHFNEIDENEYDLVHVEFNFMWTAFSNVFNYDGDIHPNCLSEAIAREPWNRKFFEKLKLSHQTHYEQWGVLNGVLKVDGYEKQILRLKSYRDHSYGMREWSSFYRYAINFAYFEDGSTINSNSISMPETLSILQCGYISLPNANICPIFSTNRDLSKIDELLNPPQRYEFKFIAGSTTYHVNVNCRYSFKYYIGENGGNTVIEQICFYEMNGLRGFGIFEYLYRTNEISIKKNIPIFEFPILNENTNFDTNAKDLIFGFDSEGGKCENLVGGKGVQLSLLSSINTEKFKVPNGFIITIEAYNTHIKGYPEILNNIRNLCSLSVHYPEKIKSLCYDISNSIKSSKISNIVIMAIEKKMYEMFGEKFDQLSFAIRSSSIGEDGSDASSAGQMSTLLGVKGKNKIFEAILECWASLYSYVAVAYRRQHGQPIITSMGVVVQEMAKASAAGVIFTWDPISRDPSLMIINANFGLGESVVSGETDPDEFFIRKIFQRGADVKFKLEKKIIGKKETFTVINDKGDGIQDKKSLNNENIICISDKDILRLANIANELEHSFSSPRDIEFVIDDGGNIYLLQARPITTLDCESDYELMHEFDSAISWDQEIITTANIQEMMPGAMTPLTLSKFIPSIDKAIQKMSLNCGTQNDLNFVNRNVHVFSNHGFISLIGIMRIYEGTSLIGNKRMCELAILGETLNSLPMSTIQNYHGELPWWNRAINAFWQCWDVRKATKRLEKLSHMSDTFNFKLEHTTADELYRDIDAKGHILEEAWEVHTLCSSSSGIWANVLMVILSQGQYVWNQEHYSDVASMLANCEGVYSADVPAALKELTNIIKKMDPEMAHAKSSLQEFEKWLNSADSKQAGISFKEFLDRHGHRCVREAEFREKSWAADPTKVLKVIQSMVLMPEMISKTQRHDSIDEVIGTLKSKITPFSKFILKKILPRARAGVANRELSKSGAVKVSDKFKKAYWTLAELLLQEGRLPDTDLLMFLTHREIEQLMKNRSAKLIIKAIKRRNLMTKFSCMNFIRINYGIPEPISEKLENNIKDNVLVTLKGLPVSQGTVKGIVRVIRTLEEASTIQQGEILVVPYTDVGWSPYFPIISGLVTEIGGLLSHGAVVAREYGLPCIVNVQNATCHFKSGDMVLLNGTLGTLEKLEI